MKLLDVARVIRSKNAVPTTLTVALMFNDTAGYKCVLAAPSLAPVTIEEI